MARRGKPHGRCGTHWEGRASEETAALTGVALAACRVMSEQRSVTAPRTVLDRWGWGGDSVRLDLKGQGREALFDDIRGAVSRLSTQIATCRCAGPGTPMNPEP
jgi:hypothetical protein